MKVLITMKLRLLLVALLGCVALLASACAPEIELLNPSYLQDTSLITQDPCAAPCWNGIIPGVTRWGDAVALIQDNPDFQDVNEQQSDETDEIVISFQRKDGVPCCLVYTSDGNTVDQILLQLAPDVTVAQVIEAHGESTYVTGNVVTEDQANLGLYYPELQTVIYAFVAGEQGALSAESPIWAVVYVRESDIEEMIRISPLYLWDGYKTYAEYITGNYDVTPVPTEAEADADTE